MWTKVWLLLGREAEIPNHGDWQMEEVGPEEILMVRQKDGGVKAFYNVCQHRANPLVDGPKGHVLRRFVCKYHSWAFLPDGTLNFAPDKEDFPEGNPCGKVRLQELRCETFAGFIFVNMDPDCKVLENFWVQFGKTGKKRHPYLEKNNGKHHVVAMQLESGS